MSQNYLCHLKCFSLRDILFICADADLNTFLGEFSLSSLKLNIKFNCEYIITDVSFLI
jgi:hypothetical protein